MSMSTTSSPPPGPPPDAIALEIATGHWKSQALVAFVKTGLPDVMRSSKSTDFESPADLAKKTGLNTNAVHRLLRFLSTMDVCIEKDTCGEFKLGPIGDVCTQSHPQSAAAKIALEGGAQHVNLWMNMPLYLQTGKKVTKASTGQYDYWDMCKANPEHLQVFQEAMSSYTGGEVFMMKTPHLSPTLDLVGIETVCDLGCAEGALSLALSERFPDCKYILSDLKEATDRLDASSLPSNFELIPCDFFKKNTIPKANAYLLKHIIHDWDDAKSIAILKNIKHASPNAKVFIMEFGPMPGPNVSHLSKMFDLHMALCFDGHERTQGEYDSVYEKSGFKLEKTHLLAGGDFPLYVQEICAV